MYDVGEEASLPSCRQFLCLTGFIFLLLTKRYRLNEALLALRTMGELNGMAADLLLILAKPTMEQDPILRETLGDLIIEADV